MYTTTGAGWAQMMDVNLLGAHHRDQLASERPENRLGVLGGFGQEREPAHPREHGGEVDLVCAVAGTRRVQAACVVVG